MSLRSLVDKWESVSDTNYCLCQSNFKTFGSGSLSSCTVLWVNLVCFLGLAWLWGWQWWRMGRGRTWREFVRQWGKLVDYDQDHLSPHQKKPNEVIWFIWLVGTINCSNKDLFFLLVCIIFSIESHRLQNSLFGLQITGLESLSKLRVRLGRDENMTCLRLARR